MLEVRKNGQGKDGHKKRVLFPKSVLSRSECTVDRETVEDVFEAGMECSRKSRAIQDWLSLTGDGYVPSISEKIWKGHQPDGMPCIPFSMV